jgi:hypothetical protein
MRVVQIAPPLETACDCSFFMGVLQTKRMPARRGRTYETGGYVGRVGSNRFILATSISCKWIVTNC